MKRNISELISLPDLQELMSALYRATGINHTLLDAQGKILTAAGWQKCCADFHRANPESCENCHISDQYIAQHLTEEGYIGYQCLNGLFDYATPLKINGEHMATMFSGQVLHTTPDMAHFRQQAEKFGFDEAAYLESIQQVNVVSSERMADVMDFLTGLTQMLARIGAARLEFASKMEQEKRRVAREMHDELGQLLTAQAMHIAVLNLRFGESNPELRERANEMAALVEKTIHAVRHLATSLRPAALDLGLLPALEWLAADFNQRGQGQCRVDAPCGDITLDDATVTELFRIVQEALTNVLRHANAGTVLISLRKSESSLYLDVRDDGCGFDASALRDGHGFGLQSMRERAMALGQPLAIETGLGRGTCISIRLALALDEKQS